MMNYRDGRPRFLMFMIGSIAFVLLNISCNQNPKGGDRPAGQSAPVEPLARENVRLGIPGTNGQIIYRDGYALLHDGEKKVSLWVSYFLTEEEARGTIKRIDRFKADPKIRADERATLSDYKGSGYDRGHLAPAADMKWSKEAVLESFFPANMAPQTPGLNRGKWKSLESAVRGFVNLVKACSYYGRGWGDQKRNHFVSWGLIADSTNGAIAREPMINVHDTFVQTQSIQERLIFLDMNRSESSSPLDLTPCCSSKFLT